MAYEHLCPSPGAGQDKAYTVTEHEVMLPVGAIQHFSIEPGLEHVRCLDCGEKLER